MHFQVPSREHEKIVYFPKESILDVVVDLVKKSRTHKKYISVPLTDK